MKDAPTSVNDVRVAVICALVHEGDAVEKFFNQKWKPQDLPFLQGKTSARNLILGRIEHHFVVLAWLHRKGKGGATSTATILDDIFPDIKLVLVVGVCGGMPPHPKQKAEIQFGDVIISEGIIPYDEGKWEEKGYLNDKELLHQHWKIGGLIKRLSSKNGCKELRESALRHLQAKPPDAQDRASESEQTRKPNVHFGYVASGDTVIKWEEFRNEIVNRGRYKPIAFEMEAAGAETVFSNLVVVIKGVCDYADKEKNKAWQPYAASAGAAYMRAFLDEWQPSSVQTAVQDIAGGGIAKAGEGIAKATGGIMKGSKS